MKKELGISKYGFMRLMIFGFLAWVALAIPLPAFSQGCALCYTQAASTGARMIQALKSGILILVIPPTLGSIGMIFVMRHKDGQVRQSEDESAQDW